MNEVHICYLHLVLELKTKTINSHLKHPKCGETGRTLSHTYSASCLIMLARPTPTASRCVSHSGAISNNKQPACLSCCLLMSISDIPTYHRPRPKFETVVRIVYGLIPGGNFLTGEGHPQAPEKRIHSIVPVQRTRSTAPVRSTHTAPASLQSPAASAAPCQRNPSGRAPPR